MNHYHAHLPEDASRGPIHGSQTPSALYIGAAATHEEAREQALVAADARFDLRTGCPIRSRDPATFDAAYRAGVERYLEHDIAIIVGTYGEAAQALSSFTENHSTEEVILISYVNDVGVKTRRYAELITHLL